MSKKIAVIVGSLRKESINRYLAQALISLAPEGYEFKQLDIGNLPLYNQDDDANQADVVKKFKADVEASDALLFVTPEYNRSIPGVLKNAIDNASRPWGKSSWTGKPGGVIGISPSGLGTALAQEHLRGVLVNQQVPVYTGTEMYLQDREGTFDASGKLVSDHTWDFLKKWLTAYLAFVDSHAK